eukprot:6468595-Prymnesium_polylepis.1
MGAPPRHRLSLSGRHEDERGGRRVHKLGALTAGQVVHVLHTRDKRMSIRRWRAVSARALGVGQTVTIGTPRNTLAWGNISSSLVLTTRIWSWPLPHTWLKNRWNSPALMLGTSTSLSLWT